MKNIIYKQIIYEEQSGFRKNRKTIKHIFNLRLICEKHNLNKKSYITYLFTSAKPLSEFGKREFDPK